MSDSNGQFSSNSPLSLVSSKSSEVKSESSPKLIQDLPKTATKFNILDLIDTENKPHNSPSSSTSSDGVSVSDPVIAPLAMLDPRLAIPQLAAFFQQNFGPAMLANSQMLAAASSGANLANFSFAPWMNFPAPGPILHATFHQNAEPLKDGENDRGFDAASNGTQNGKKDPSLSQMGQEPNETSEGTRNSIGGSPLESDAEEDDETAEPRGSDDDANNADQSLQRKKKTRTVFSRHQVSQLETMFEMKRYLTSQERAQMAQRLQLTETQVKIWWQNRRNKFKRQAATDDQTNSLQLHRANLFINSQPQIGSNQGQNDRQQALSIPSPLLPPGSLPSGVNIRNFLPAPLDVATATRLLLGQYGNFPAI
ncbi:hypothetical protein WR25_17910 [Diploscapter pachys]|uniref:Homeobox domain-containing protein n=1 Tax=Diploscapter pachys TaxID=2018661 RepID=A0A2A2KTM9_9BILA|nr:hypothetical protein WR25_17910 [Diploscapter pachys]